MGPSADITIAIPAYNRSAELYELLCSIENQQRHASEVLVCEDCSPDRDEIRDVVEKMRGRLERIGYAVTYIENEKNLGYDGNVRKIIRLASSRWAMLMGNDDLLLPNGILDAENFLKVHEAIKMTSRSFVRFHNDILKPLGVSRVSNRDKVFINGQDASGMLFRICGFVSGLVVNIEWARSVETDRYDGTLFYQIFLASLAFCSDGIGYIERPIVAGRTGNPPLFGSASTEKDSHIPGSYSPKGRARMWRGVLDICREIGAEKGINLEAGIRQELKTRQAFHVFEMMAGASPALLKNLRSELKLLGLYDGVMPITLFWLVRIFGERSRWVFRLTRRVLQREVYGA